MHMQQRELGSTGAQVSAIGYGSWPMAGRMGAVDEAQAADALRVALDAGVTIVDTAQGYDDAELPDEQAALSASVVGKEPPLGAFDPRR